VPVSAVDLLHRGAHHPRQLEDRDARRERLSREGVTQVVRATPLDPGSVEGLLPVAGAEVVEVDVLAVG
jgi:hypothetical protein